MHLHRQRKELARLRGWVRVSLDFGTRNRPDRCRKFTCQLSNLSPERFWLFSFNPAEQTRLVLPQINRVGKYRTTLHPDNLLMHECAKLIPDRFEHHLAARCMPAVPGRITGDCMLDRRTHEAAIQFDARIFAVFHICASRFYVVARPVLVAVRSALVSPTLGVRTAGIAHSVRGISREEDRPFAVHQTNHIFSVGRVTAQKAMVADLTQLTCFASPLLLQLAGFVDLRRRFKSTFGVNTRPDLLACRCFAAALRQLCRWSGLFREVC